MESYKAIRIGLVLVTFSAILFMLLGLAVGIVTFIEFDFHIVFILGFMLLGLIVYWPFWSYILVKWKLWSYENVDDFKVFIKLAKKRALIYPDSHFYSRYEFCSKRDKRVLKEIFDKRIKENTNRFLFEKYKYETIFIKAGMSRLFDNTPLLEISLKGLKFRKTDLIRWKNISIVRVQSTGGKYPSYSIEMMLKNDHRIYIHKMNNMKTSYSKLEYYIDVFKQLAETKVRTKRN